MLASLPGFRSGAVPFAEVMDAVVLLVFTYGALEPVVFPLEQLPPLPAIREQHELIAAVISTESAGCPR